MGIIPPVCQCHVQHSAVKMSSMTEVCVVSKACCWHVWKFSAYVNKVIKNLLITVLHIYTLEASFSFGL